MRIKEWIGFSYGNRTREFYFRNNQLFFVYEQFDSFRETDDGLDHSNYGYRFQGRYYFQNGKLIKTLTSGKKLMAADDKNINKELLDSGKEYAILLSKKNAQSQ